MPVQDNEKRHMTPSLTLFDKLWQEHCIQSDASGEDLLLIDRILLHERTGAVALEALREKGREVKTPAHVFCTMDHIVSNRPGRTRNEARTPGGDVFISSTRESAARSGVTLIDIDDARQGIVHVMAPELGIVQPGVSIVCPDSHTCSLGAFGALAWGIGSSAAEHALATQTLKQKKPANMRVTLKGALQPGVYAKDIVLALIAQVGAGAAANHAVEFTGEGVRQMSMEGRMTLCNMAVEFAAFTALIAPDEKTFEYLAGREFAPTGAQFDEALSWWRDLASDEEAAFDKDIILDTDALAPQISWGVSPEQSGGIDQTLPLMTDLPAEKEKAVENALAYMGLQPGQRLLGEAVDGAFIGSCTNGRIEDLRAAASILKGTQISPDVKAICVPGSQAVKRQAEEEGIAEIFKQAGFEWGEPGCGYCFYAGGDTFAPGARVVSSTNRNFEGRQGPGVRTHLCSPATVAASAIAGVIADPREAGGVRPV